MTELILRIQSPNGTSRISLKTTDSFQTLANEIERISGIASANQLLAVNGKSRILLPPTTPLGRIPGLEDGTIIKVESKVVEAPQTAVTQSAPQTTGAQQKAQEAVPEQTVRLTSNCNHGSNGRCINCAIDPNERPDVNVTKAKCQHGPNGRCINCATKDDPKGEKSAPKGKCLHGPNGRCFNCAGVDSKKEELSKSGEKYLGQTEAKRCNHGPNGRCLNCAIKDTSEVKHLSFDDYVDRNFAKCRNHSKNQKCQNCFVDLAVEFKINMKCKNHEPYPKGMCSQCIPPSINVKRQEYRHVDYVEFMNFHEIQRFIRLWMETGYQRVGILYGYYAEDPVYEKGVRAIVEVLYEPPQENKFNDTVLLEDPYQHQLEQIIHSLGFERIGFVFTTFNKSAFLTNQEFIRAAQMQEQYAVNHPIGMRVPKQVTLVLRGKLTRRP